MGSWLIAESSSSSILIACCKAQAVRRNQGVSRRMQSVPVMSAAIDDDARAAQNLRLARNSCSLRMQSVSVMSAAIDDYDERMAQILRFARNSCAVANPF